MKTILDQLQIEPTGRRSVDAFDSRVQILDAGVNDLGPSYNSTIQFANEYRLWISLGVNFRANPVMYQEQLKLAKHRIARGLFSPVHDKLDEIQDHVYAGDRDGALRVITELRKLMGE